MPKAKTSVTCIACKESGKRRSPDTPKCWDAIINNDKEAKESEGTNFSICSKCIKKKGHHGNLFESRP